MASNQLSPQPSPEEVFRKHYAELSRLVSDSTNRLSLAPELFAACLITLECYGSATDNSPKTDIEKGLLLMRGLMSTIKSQPQSLTKIIDSLRKVEAFKLIAENMWTMCVDTDKLKLSRQRSMSDHCISGDINRRDEGMNSMVMNIKEKQRYIEELKSQLEKQRTITRTQALKIEDLKSRLEQIEELLVKKQKEIEKLKQTLDKKEETDHAMIEDKQRNDKSLMTSFEAQKIVVNERSVEMIHITREKEVQLQLELEKDLSERRQSEIVKLNIILKEKEESFQEIIEDIQSNNEELLAKLKMMIYEKNVEIEDLKSQVMNKEDSQSRGFLKTGINDEEEKSAGFLKNLYTKFFREKEGSVHWSNDRVWFISPTMEQCEEVISQVMGQKQTRKQWNITLRSLSPNTSIMVLGNIDECLVRSLEIWNTSLDSNCVSKLSHILTYSKTIERIWLRNSSLLPNDLEMIANALSTNTTLKTLWIEDESTITDKEIPHICHIISANTTLEELYLNNCHKITKTGRQQISKVLGHNMTLIVLCINGNFLR